MSVQVLYIQQEEYVREISSKQNWTEQIYFKLHLQVMHTKL